MFFAHMYHTTKLFLYVFFVPNAYQESVTQNSKKLQKYTIICEIYVKNNQFCHIFAKKPDKIMTTQHVVTYVQMRVKPYIFTKFFLINLQTYIATTMYTNLVTYTRAIIVLFVLI